MRYLSGSALTILDASAKHLNFSRVAEELGLTPAAVSHQVRELESRFGFQLFVRKSSGLALTEAGRIMCDQATRSLIDLRRAHQLASSVHTNSKTVRITSSARFAAQFLIRNINKFKYEFPGISVDMEISDKQKDLINDNFDVAFRFCQAPTESDVFVEKLFNTSVIAVCSNSFWNRHEATIRKPADLERFMLCHVACEVAGQRWPNWTDWFNTAGVSDAPHEKPIAFQDLTQVIQAVYEQEAIGLVEKELVENELKDGRLQRLFNFDITLPESIAYYLLIPNHRMENESVRIFYDWLKNEVLLNNR